MTADISREIQGTERMAAIDYISNMEMTQITTVVVPRLYLREIHMKLSLDLFLYD